MQKLFYFVEVFFSPLLPVGEILSPRLGSEAMTQSSAVWLHIYEKYLISAIA